jgi:hypothetical protein
VASAGTSCRAASGICDVAEVCDGSSKTCPTNRYAANGTSCGPTSYGSWGSCGGFTGYCPPTGSQSRSVTTLTCQSGACTGIPSTQTRTCTEPTPSCGNSSTGGRGRGG